MDQPAVLLLVGAAAQQLKDRLEASGYSSISCKLAEVPKLLAGVQLAAVLISKDACDICLQLRNYYGEENAPALLLEASHNDLAARSLCLEWGADDYWLADAPPSDLLQRLRHQIQLHQQTPKSIAAINPHQLSLGNLRLDQKERRAWRGNRDLGLTAREYALLLILIEQPGVCVSRKTILEQVWGLTETSEANIIEVYVRYLRRKLEADGEKRLIHTVRGHGYCLRSNDS